MKDVGNKLFHIFFLWPSGIVEYVKKVLSHASEFAKKSKADKNIKNKEPAAILGFPKGGHWITKDGKHILIKGPKQ